MRRLHIYRYDPERDAPPRLESYDFQARDDERMLLDALMRLKAIDPTLSLRRSCREGMCGSDAMNINGKNGLARVTNLRALPSEVVLKPLPGLPVIRDLIVDMTGFLQQYHSTACPSFWCNPDTHVGPAGLLQACRFLVDSRDEASAARLADLDDPYRLFRCRTILNCADVCPKGLNPALAIGQIKAMLVRRST